MEPCHLDQDGETFAVSFERSPEGWLCRIRRESDGATQLAAFPEAAGFDPQDVRGSLIAGCRAAIAGTAWPAPARH